jgi:hypothetical protein
MAKSPGQCIFCGRRPPAVKMSREHIFADWLKTIFPRDNKTTHTHGVITWPSDATPQTPPAVATRQGQGHSGSKKVKVVCKSCNETWLSNSVENAAKPILTPLIAGRAGSVTSDMQRVLATWAAKTVMTAEHVNRGKAVVQQAERTWLKDKLLPPAGWFIWAAPYSGTHWRDLGIFQHSGKLEIPAVSDGASTEHNLGLTFIGLGHLLFLIRHSTWPRLWDVLGSPLPNAHQIWPVGSNSIQWPAPYVLTDIETEHFTTYMTRVFNQRVL